MSSETPAVELEKVCFTYGPVTVLRDVTLTLPRGDFLGILGPNGGGKTTLLKLMLGLLKPDSGTIRILGDAPRKANHRIGYVPQGTDFNNSFPISAFEIALMGRLSLSRIGRPYSKEDRQKAAEALSRVGMLDYAQVRVGRLSGGQRQRVFIARALAADPEILFLDEPTSSADPEFETDLYSFLKELNRRVTIVLITHDVGVISRYVKSVACVNRTLVFHADGKITSQMLDAAYSCPVDLIAHGVPHRVFPSHGDR